MADATTIVSGAARRGTTIWDFAGSCTMPVPIQLESGVAVPEWQIGIRQRVFAQIIARCRKCKACLSAFYQHWHERTLEEMARCTRAMMLTLTFAGKYGPTTARAWTEVRNYIRRLRLYAERRGIRTDLRFMYVLQRGENGTKRLHVHMIMCENGDPLPDDAYNFASDEFPRGQWHAGWCKVEPVRMAHMEKAAGYVLRYCLREHIDIERDAAETLPGGRRLAASPFWGPGRIGAVAPQAAWPPQQSMDDWIRANALDTPRPQHAAHLDKARAYLEQTTSDGGKCPTCALAFKSQEQTKAGTDPPHPLKALAEHIGGKGAQHRILKCDEIPTQIKKLWPELGET
jgi:hypothetical protein